MSKVNFPPYPHEGPRDDKREDGPSLQEIYASRMRSVHVEIGKDARILADATAGSTDFDTATMTPLDEMMWEELDRLATDQANG